jgi:DNA-binding response OmpR family regulator
VILTSAYHLSERQILRADCGAVGFVPKPYDLTELARFLRAKMPGGSTAMLPRSIDGDDAKAEAARVGTGALASSP